MTVRQILIAGAIAAVCLVLVVAGIEQFMRYVSVGTHCREIGQEIYVGISVTSEKGFEIEMECRPAGRTMPS